MYFKTVKILTGGSKPGLQYEQSNTVLLDRDQNAPDQQRHLKKSPLNAFFLVFWF